MNKQDKSLIKELREMEISKLPDTDFKLIVINKPVELRKRMNSVRTSTDRKCKKDCIIQF